MFDGLDPDLVSRLILASIAVAVALLALVVGLHFLRRRNSHLFVKGGRAREQRLHVLDAAAVDAKRRLVLVRRDDVEHLIMIGGPVDVVIETGIGQAGAQVPATVDKLARAEPVSAPARTEPKTVEPSPNILVATAQDVDTTSASDMMDSLIRGEPPQRTREPTVDDSKPDAVATRKAAEPAPQPQVSVTPPVSAMGSVLYRDDAEPMAGRKVQQSAASTAQQAVVRKDPVTVTPSLSSTARPTTESAASVLEQARGRVLASDSAREHQKVESRIRSVEMRPAPEPRPAVDDTTRAMELRLETAKLEAARLEAARLEAARRAAQSIQAAAPVLPAARNGSPTRNETGESGNLQSDFEQFLEAELQAGGIVDAGPVPIVRGDVTPVRKDEAESAAPSLGGMRRET